MKKINIDYSNISLHFDVVDIDGTKYFCDINRELNITDKNGVFVEQTNPDSYIIMECPPETLKEDDTFDMNCEWWSKTYNRSIFLQYFRKKYK